MSRYWYAYLGGSGTQPQLNSANYRLLSSSPTCAGVNEICAIYSPTGGSNPNSPLSQNLQSYVIAALASNLITQYPASPQKAFVYKKD